MGKIVEWKDGDEGGGGVVYIGYALCCMRHVLLQVKCLDCLLSEY